ncbi:unnamed protein product [Lactuca saligna]|uniref:Uncharacterized protein n=1 Tax=Lactuca saligna TaxID=75948 RepID=A0AA36EMG1_LACSI|nr:unnamed protein product [Lactuca saligna]
MTILPLYLHEGLIKIVEESVKIDQNLSPNKPVYFLGESFDHVVYRCDSGFGVLGLLVDNIQHFSLLPGYLFWLVLVGLLAASPYITMDGAYHFMPSGQSSSLPPRSYHVNLQQLFWTGTFLQKILCTCSSAAIVDSGTSMLTGPTVCISREASARIINLRDFKFFIFLVSN